MLDILVHNGLVADGTGGPLLRWGVGIQDGCIAWLGRNSAPPSRRQLNAAGLVVCPGFIDVHTHSDLSLLNTPAAEHKLYQGITTEVLGNCGLSVAPLPADRRLEIQAYVARLLGGKPSETWPWSQLAEYLDHLESVQPAVNACTLAAHGIIRLAVMGFDERPASADEMAAMESVLATAMADGAFGLSSGLQYPPGCYATQHELVRLAAVAAGYGGIYATHMRNQSTGLIQSVRDSIQVGREAGVPVEISHLLAMGEPSWALYGDALRLIEEARQDGLDVTYDMYPYAAGCTMLRAILPPWVMEGGNESAVPRLRDPAARARIQADLEGHYTIWDNLSRMAGWHNLVLIQLHNPSNRQFVGFSIQEAADREHLEPLEFALDLLVSEAMEGTIVAFISSEDNIRQAVCGPFAMFGSDSLHTPDSMGMVHPRTYGAYARYFAKYVREGKDMPLEEAVRKATSLPAARLGLFDRGLIRPGMAADIVIFDPDAIQDIATYANPRQFSRGVVHVLVNGKLVVEDSQITGVRSGMVLRRTSMPSPPRLATRSEP